MLTSHFSLSLPVRSDRHHRRQVRRAIAAGECAGRNQADLLEMLIVTPSRPSNPSEPPHAQNHIPLLWDSCPSSEPLYLLESVVLCSSFKTVSCLCFPLLNCVWPPTCIWISLFILHPSSLWRSFHCLNGPWHSSWLRTGFLHCRCLSCVLFLFLSVLRCVVCRVCFLSWTPSAPFSALNISVSVPYQVMLLFSKASRTGLRSTSPTQTASEQLMSLRASQVQLYVSLGLIVTRLHSTTISCDGPLLFES